MEIGGQRSVVLRPKNEVPVVGHDAPGEQTHRRLLRRLAEHFFERREIARLGEDGKTPDAAIERVVDETTQVAAEAARHANRMRAASPAVKRKRAPDPLFPL